MTYVIDYSFCPKEWDAYLEASRRATVYHTLEWRSILKDIFRYETRYAVCRNGAGDIAALLPIAMVRSWITGNRVDSLPFSQYGGPLVSDTGALECIVEHLKEYLRYGFQYVRLRARDPLEQNSVMRSSLKLSEYHSRCAIPLQSRIEDDVWKSMNKSSVRWAIGRSARAGVVVEFGLHLNGINRVKDLMFQTCRKHGVPSYSPRLLKAIGDVLVPKNLARIFLARLDKKIIATLILFTMNKEAIYAYSFSDPNYLKFYPNNALIWAAIKWSLNNGLREFDMGVSSPQDNRLLSFKMRWGAIEDKLHDYYISKDKQADIVLDRRASRKYRLATLAWRFLLPNFLTETIGPKLVSHFG